MKHKRVLAVLFAILLLAAPLVGAAAASVKDGIPLDVGNFNDYDSGGYDSGGWDSGGYDSGGYDWSSSSSSSSSSSGDGDWDFGTILVIVAILVIAGVFKGKGGKGGKGGNTGGNRPSGGSVNVGNFNDMINAELVSIDPAFSREEFISWSKEVFITLQEAWTAREWEKIRPFEKEELFAQHKRQLDEYIRLGRTNIIERINVNDAYLHLYERDSEYESLTVYMSVRMVDYIIDDKTKNVLKGDPNRDCFMKYLLTFTRKTGVLTDTAGGKNSIVACPNCGAPTEITSAGKCEYCGFIVTTGDYCWVLCNMVAVKPGVGVNNSGVVIR